MDVQSIARIAHEVNRAYCASLGDYSQKSWEESPGWQKDSAINGVNFHLTAIKEGREIKPSDSHDSWLKQKLAEGWSYGPEKDPAAKKHPCCVPYEELPQEQRAKDFIFGGVVRAVASATL